MSSCIYPSCMMGGGNCDNCPDEKKVTKARLCESSYLDGTNGCEKYTKLLAESEKMRDACYRASKMQKYHKGEYFYTTTVQCEEALESYKQWEKEGLEK